MAAYRFTPNGKDIEICAANAGRWCKITEKMFIVEFQETTEIGTNRWDLVLTETADVTKVRDRESVDQQFMTEILPQIAEPIREKMPDKSER